MQKIITIGDRKVAADQITEMAFHLSDQGGCCVDMAMDEHGQPRHEVMQFGADSDGATDFARNLMNEIWPTGWLFSDLKRYKDGVSFCHVKASVVEADTQQQRSWLFVLVPDLSLHSMLDELNQEYGGCAGTAWEGTM